MKPQGIDLEGFDPKWSAVNYTELDSFLLKKSFNPDKIKKIIEKYKTTEKMTFSKPITSFFQQKVLTKQELEEKQVKIAERKEKEKEKKRKEIKAKKGTIKKTKT